MAGTRRYRKSALLFLTLILVLEISQYECYPHKRDLNSMPQVINILSDGLREEVKQTDLLGSITATCTSDELGFPKAIGLLGNQTRHLENISVSVSQLKLTDISATLESISATVAQHEAKQTTQLQLLQNISVSLERLSRNSPFTARDCSDIASQGPYRSGPYTISTWDEQGSFKVYCDMDNEGGWTVIQKRFDGSVDFSRGWEDYKNGFGNIGGEMWLGLDKMNRLTSVNGGSWTLRVELTGFDESTAYAQYDDFIIGDETSNFALISLGQYTGTAGDSLTPHLNGAFTTEDRDDDQHSSSCAQTYGGAWWYKVCYLSSLNGPYLASAVTTYHAIVWEKWKSQTALKKVDMKIKLIN